MNEHVRGWCDALNALAAHHDAQADAAKNLTQRSVHLVIADAARRMLPGALVSQETP